MQSNTNALPDNLLGKFSRIYRAQHSFKADDGQTVNYERLVLEYMVKGEPLTMEIPIKKDSPVTPKDTMLLGIADKLDESVY